MQQASWYRTKHLHTSWLSCMFTLFLLFFSSCSAQLHASPQGTAHLTSTARTTNAAAHSNSAETATSEETNLDRQHKFFGPNGWIWRTSLPNDRLVIYYGNPGSTEMGPLGAYSDDELIAKLQAQAQVYANLDTSHPVVPAFDYVTPIVQPVAMQDGSWVYRM